MTSLAQRIGLLLMVLTFAVYTGMGQGAPTTQTTQPVVAKLVQVKHQQMLYPMVRVKAPKGTGSGTILYSEDRAEKGTFRTFVLTNHHVVESAIAIARQWNNLRQEYENVEVCEHVLVEVFRYTDAGVEDGRVQYDAVVQAYEQDEDLALLELQTQNKLPYVAQILPTTAVRPSLFETVYAVGCSLAHAPVHSNGQLTSLNDIMERKQYWMVSSPIVFGNSGGAVFLERPEGYFWIGVPSRVAATGSQIIPHMAYIIPLTRVTNWLNSQKLSFLLNPSKTPEQCFIDRQQYREARRAAAQSPSPQGFAGPLPDCPSTQPSTQPATRIETVKPEVTN